MASGIPSSNGPNHIQQPDLQTQVQTNMVYGTETPGFTQILEHWFPGQVTPQMVIAFEQGMMQMISNSINRSKAQHEKVQQEIQKRIKEG
jgi:hypothetical protein